ncbi:sensor histidine kinase [Paenibacillus ginsengarvi]|uniref:sensor histidine kinase n=1 Tax=Paenibacillus ginsengarvi TaxID=400777 RepID=UPI001EFF6D74|nr:histidine kinase dimerization/phospho-acceptor domain-containing protein [Paenibacillus ginsengarvi]
MHRTIRFLKLKGSSIIGNPVVLLLLFSLFLFGARAVWYVHYSPPEHPRAIGGVLDLRGWDFQNSKMIPLDGQWEFYPDQLLTGRRLNEEQPGKSQYLQVPGDWRSAWISERNHSYGFGTYRLRILIDGPLDRQPYEFWFSDIYSSSQVEVNGNVMAGLGQLGVNRQQYEPQVRSFTVSYTPEQEREIELLVQVANFDRPTKGGITSAIRFGSQARIDTERWNSIGMQLVGSTVFLLHSIYTLILYAFNSRQKSILASFGMMICVGISILSSSDRLITVWLPLTDSIRVKVLLLSYLYLTYFMVMLTIHLLNRSTRSWLFRIYSASLLLYTLFLCAAPYRAVYHVIFLINLFYLLPIAAVFVLFALQVIRQRRRPGDDLLLFMAAICVASSVLWGALKSYISVPVDYYPIDMILALIAFSSYWFRRYFRNAEENARLTERLTLDDRRKDEFLAHTAHELRTPLHGLINIARTVLNEESGSLRPRNAEGMRLLLTIGSRMSQLINDLLDAARLKEKRLSWTPASCPCSRLPPLFFRCWPI